MAANCSGSGVRSALALFLFLAALPGAGGCARSVNDYLAEARSNSPGAVKEAVIAIGEILHRKESAGLPLNEADREALLYLKDVARSDTIPINRSIALGALGMLRGAQASDIFLAALKDPFWLVRLEAARAMAEAPRDAYAEPLRDLLLTETRPEVRLEIVKALGQVKGPVALRTLLEVFFQRGAGPGDPQVHAYSSIREISGLSYGFYELNDWAAFYKQTFGAPPGTAGSAPVGGRAATGSPPPAERGAGQ